MAGSFQEVEVKGKLLLLNAALYVSYTWKIFNSLKQASKVSILCVTAAYTNVTTKLLAIKKCLEEIPFRVLFIIIITTKIIPRRFTLTCLI